MINLNIFKYLYLRIFIKLYSLSITFGLFIAYIYE